jgi:hypothetical protein
MPIISEKDALISLATNAVTSPSSYIFWVWFNCLGWPFGCTGSILFF